MRRGLWCAALCALTAVRFSSQAAPDGQTPTFRADTHLVQVSVVVEDSRSNPVTDLTARDFRVFEDGAEQTISDSPNPPEPRRARPRIAVRDPVSGAVGSVTVPVKMVRSVMVEHK